MSKPNSKHTAPEAPALRLRVLLGAVVLAVPVIYLLDTWNRAVPLPADYDGSIYVDRRGYAIHGYDVVAYFTEEQPVKGSRWISTTHAGARFLFSSRANRKKFRENPEAYIPAYGGFCALGVANGYKDHVIPSAFEIVDGRLFLNLSHNIHESWRAGKHRYIADGDANWPELREVRGRGRP